MIRLTYISSFANQTTAKDIREIGLVFDDQNPSYRFMKYAYLINQDSG